MNAAFGRRTVAPPPIDVPDVARRVVIILAAATGAFGVLCGVPLVTVALRAGAVLLCGLVAVGLATRAARLLGPGGLR